MKLVLKKIGEGWGKVADLVGKAPARRIDMAIAAVVTLAAIAVYVLMTITVSANSAIRFLDTVEVRSLDARFRARGPRPVDDRIVIVGLDEKTLQKIGSYPIARNFYGQAVEQMTAAGARVIGFDIDFPTPEKNSAVDALKKLESELPGAPAPVVDKIREIERTSDNDVILANDIKKAGNVVLGHIFVDAARAREMDAKAAEDYYNVLWGHPFPQVVKQPAGASFDLNKAWNDTLDNTGNVLTGRQAGSQDGPLFFGIESNIRLIAEAARSYGFFNYAPDRDGIYRRAYTLVRYRDREWFPSLPLEMLKACENIKDQATVAYINSNGMSSIELGPHTFNTEPDGTVLINFAGPFHSYPHYSLADVLDGSVLQQDPHAFQGKLVLLGYTAVGVGDIRPMPFQEANYMGIELHANVLDNMLNNDIAGRGFLRRGVGEEMIDLLFILAFGLGMGFLFARLKPLKATFSMLAAVAAFLGICYLAFSHWGMWLYVVIPAGTLLVNYGAITSFRMVFEEREKRKVRRTFERYVSPGVIRLIEQDPKKYFKAGGESKPLTIMFSDIRSFTTISEGMSPDELVFFLNEYLGDMTDILFKRWGTLDKYIGDALMAFWGSPFPQADHAKRACSAAIDMSKRLEELNLKWELENKKPIEIGIGINTGVVNVGNMGSSRRFAWTVMGDPVNLASRLEGQNKDYHTTRIISEFTYAEVKNDFVCRDLDRIRVKGKLKPVGIYELLDFANEAGKYKDLLARWSEAQSSFYAHNYDAAIQHYEAILARYPNDGPSQTFMKRALEYRVDAPAPDWDGVYVAKTK